MICMSCNRSVSEEHFAVGACKNALCENGHDPVNSPSHYRGNGMEAIDVIEAFKLDYYLGNVVKYVLRSGKKGERAEDLSKAIWYLKRAIEKGA